MNIWLRNVAHIVPDSIKYGRYYRSTMKQLMQTEKMSESDILKFQFDKLKDMLIYASKNTLYYSKLFKEIDFDPHSFSEFKEIERIPILTKDIVRHQADELISCEFRKERLTRLSTSGSTGEPAVFYSYKKESEAKEAAFVRNAWSRIGYDGKGVTAVFRGEKITVDKEKNIFWLTPTVYFKDVYSSYDININTAPHYIKHLIERKTKWIMAFPSVLFDLCVCLSSMEVAVTSVAGIFLSSETIYDYQIDVIKRVFPNAKINLIYGHTERACFASTCDLSLNYHFQREYGFVEFLPIDDNICEIVATGFNNHAMPLIRYATGDIVNMETKTYCRCGLPFDVFSTIGGRTQNYIVTKSGQRIVGTAFIASVHTDVFDKIEKIQIEQFTKGECMIKVKPVSALSDQEIQMLTQLMNKRLNNDVDVQVVVVDSILPGKNGKNALIVQHIQ